MNCKFKDDPYKKYIFILGQATVWFMRTDINSLVAMIDKVIKILNYIVIRIDYKDQN